LHDVGLNQPRVLVTGGAGFVGVNLAPVLAARGFATRCFDNMSTGRPDHAEAAGYDDIVEGDVLDLDALHRAARDCRYVVHLAAQPGVPLSVADPVGTTDVNVGGTLNALLAGRDAHVDGFVFASSNAPLGDIDEPANENMPARPKSPYGASKLAGEGYCSAFHGSYGLPTVALRFTNVYGPYSHHKGSVVASFCKQVGAGHPLVVYGDGSQTRDFVYVEDLCEGIAAALTCGRGGVVTHLGSGVESPVIDVAKAVIDKFGGDATIEHRPERVGDVMHASADISYAQALLGFAPETSLDVGLSRTIEWFKSAE
jgi:UDP-glucose 4-epimerase